MQISESVSMALSSIRANKLRAGLTLLSISIGVFAIVGVAAAVSALNAKVDDQLASLGRNSFIIQKMPALNFGNNWRKYRNRKDITLRQATELKRRLTSAQNVSMLNVTQGAVVKYNGKATDPNITVYGGDESFIVNYDYSIADGRGIDAQDVVLGGSQAVIGADIASSLFKSETPVGKQIKINDVVYTVIGLLASKGAVFGQSQDNLVIVPITSAAQHFFDEWESSVTINVRSFTLDQLQETVDQAIGILRSIRNVDLGKPNDFEVITNESISETFGGFTKYIGIFGGICGGFALLAAGIGIMNIMLVSVKERTREIGVRKAIGATRNNILTQFLIEAITLTQFGALIGILLGLAGGGVMGLVMGIAPPIPWLWVLFAVGVCLAIGVVFGIIPAWKASRLDPIDALRYE
jgi:putative ABC transport system permease protein